jgi:cellulose synthase/poly-beta-1,6-N-acetylglucosamine synthase-like glycosyltransferase
MNLPKTSFIVHVTGLKTNFSVVTEKIDSLFEAQREDYEILFVADEFLESVEWDVRVFLSHYPVKLLKRRGHAGRGYNIQRGLRNSKFETVCVLEMGSKYPVEVIGQMLTSIRDLDIVVAQNKRVSPGALRRMLGISEQLDLIVFRREVYERLNLKSAIFDFEFLEKSHDAGYKIINLKVNTSRRFLKRPANRALHGITTLIKEKLRLKANGHEVIPFHPRIAQQKGNGFHYEGKEFVHYSDLAQGESAFYRFNQRQITLMLLILTAGVYSFASDWKLALISFVGIITVLYFLDLLFNLFLIVRSFGYSAEIVINDVELSEINEQRLPMYTILCPLYKEWQVIPQFTQAIARLDYPKSKLQVQLLLEEDDKESLSYIQRLNLPSYFETIIVPHSFPKTKPKACNYGLLQAKGGFVVIFDAEDAPEPAQLKKAVLAFERAGRQIACIQAKLNFYNPYQNFLTKAFTAEYSLWFDLVLTGLQSIKAPIPLGGTSNHFRTKDLKMLKGWDAFNVTEDADLGMRIAKQGFKTAIVSSVTLEEANSDLKNWFWQRTRWIKGYIQTYFLHMRNPGDFSNTLKKPDLLFFQMVIGGKVLSMFINPAMWMLTILYFLFRSQFGPTIESLFPPPVLYLGIVSLIGGNFLYMYYYMIGCAKHGHYGLIKYAILVPIYWLLMSAAAWMAVYKLITAPHHWSKTKHGLHLKKDFFATGSISGLNNFRGTKI